VPISRSAPFTGPRLGALFSGNSDPISQNRPQADAGVLFHAQLAPGSSPLGRDSAKDSGGSPRRPSPRTLLPMWSQREVIDYALQRRSTLQALRRPGRRLALQEACDADPMLIRAAKHHGEPSNVDCPVCESDELVNLQYVFGDQLGQYSGRIKRTTELEEMAHEFGEFKVVVVEVCPACGWNHMILSYLLGDGVKRKPPRRQQTVEDIYG
jgi:Family of unknown function (DUF5318)